VLIPGSRGLFETIQGFVEFKNMVGELEFLRNSLNLWTSLTRTLWGRGN
jgi:hypothetical protein